MPVCSLNYVGFKSAKKNFKISPKRNARNLLVLLCMIIWETIQICDVGLCKQNTFNRLIFYTLFDKFLVTGMTVLIVQHLRLLSTKRNKHVCPNCKQSNNYLYTTLINNYRKNKCYMINIHCINMHFNLSLLPISNIFYEMCQWLVLL